MTDGSSSPPAEAAPPRLFHDRRLLVRLPELLIPSSHLMHLVVGAFDLLALQEKAEYLWMH
jgi:hypothetical protein